MEFYRVIVDAGKRKRYACGCFTEITEYKRRACAVCGKERVTPNYDKMFEDKAWNMKLLLDRNYYADFIFSQVRGIVSEKAKKVLSENFSNAVDFGDIEMVSQRDIPSSFLKYYRGMCGSKNTKLIVNDPPQYYRLLLKKGAVLDFIRSGVKKVSSCKVCDYVEYDIPFELIGDSSRIYITGSTWEHYDLFNVEGMGNTMFCTERFISVYNVNNLTGLMFQPIQSV